MKDFLPLILVAVHGTWADKARWIGTGSSLSQELARHPDLGCRDVELEYFRWSKGPNSNEARLSAGRELAAFLEDLRPEGQRAHVVVVAHSHGGNVALYALQAKPALQESIAGCVCINTPFLHAKRRGRPLENVGHLADLVLHRYLTPISRTLPLLSARVVLDEPLLGLRVMDGLIRMLREGLGRLLEWVTSALARSELFHGLFAFFIAVAVFTSCLGLLSMEGGPMFFAIPLVWLLAFVSLLILMTLVRATLLLALQTGRLTYGESWIDFLALRFAVRRTPQLRPDVPILPYRPARAVALRHVGRRVGREGSRRICDWISTVVHRREFPLELDQFQTERSKEPSASALFMADREHSALRGKLAALVEASKIKFALDFRLPVNPRGRRHFKSLEKLLEVRARPNSPLWWRLYVETRNLMQAETSFLRDLLRSSIGGLEVMREEEAKRTEELSTLKSEVSELLRISSVEAVLAAKPRCTSPDSGTLAALGANVDSELESAFSAQSRMLESVRTMCVRAISSDSLVDSLFRQWCDGVPSSGAMEVWSRQARQSLLNSLRSANSALVRLAEGFPESSDGACDSVLGSRMDDARSHASHQLALGFFEELFRPFEGLAENIRQGLVAGLAGGGTLLLMFALSVGGLFLLFKLIESFL